MSGKSVYFYNFKAWCEEQLQAAESHSQECEQRIQNLRNLNTGTLAGDNLIIYFQMLGSAETDRNNAERSLSWLRSVSQVQNVPPRSLLTCKPSWSFAGNLRDVAADIMHCVSQVASSGRGTKDDLPLVYISNPIHHWSVSFRP